MTPQLSAAARRRHAILAHQHRVYARRYLRLLAWMRCLR
jgi:hypothetical protein